MNPINLYVIIDWLNQNCFLKKQFDKSTLKDFLLTGFSSIENSTQNDVTFFQGKIKKNETNSFFISDSILANVEAGILFLPFEYEHYQDKLKNVRFLAIVNNPYHVMVEFLKRFGNDLFYENSNDGYKSNIHPSAIVEGTIGKNTKIGPGCIVMKGAKIADNCILEANVTIYPNVEILENCIFQAGVVIGSRGFGFYENEGKRLPVPHFAGVKIGKRCSFGANTVVASGFVSKTTIGDDCHFDSFVQIAHNCVLGNNIYMASQSGIAGSVILEDNVEFAGGAQSAGHLTIGKGTLVAAKSGVTKSILPGKIVAGFPAVDIKNWRLSVVNLKRLGEKK